MRDIEMMLVRDVIWTRCISVLDVARNANRGQLLEGSFDAAIIKIFIWEKKVMRFSPKAEEFLLLIGQLWVFSGNLST